MTRPAERVASLDVGSNTVLALIAERGPDGVWRRVDDLSEITRVAEGLDQHGVLSRPAIDRTAAALVRFRDRLDQFGVDRVIATGTAPFRRASNGAAVAAELGEALGAPIDVVSGELEASLALLATRRAFPMLADMLVVDIGGASTELIHARADGTSTAISLDIGSVRLRERCIVSDPVDDTDVVRLDAAIHAELSRPGAAEVLAAVGIPVVGIAGTVTTVAAVAIGLETWDESRIHGMRLATGGVGDVFERVRCLSLADRQRVPGLEPKRADVFPAGARLLHQILLASAAADVVVSDRGIRWGRLHFERA